MKLRGRPEGVVSWRFGTWKSRGMCLERCQNECHTTGSAVVSRSVLDGGESQNYYRNRGTSAGVKVP